MQLKRNREEKTKQKKYLIMQHIEKKPLQFCIGSTIRIGRDSWCLPYAGFLIRGLKSYNFA